MKLCTLFLTLSLSCTALATASTRQSGISSSSSSSSSRGVQTPADRVVAANANANDVTSAHSSRVLEDEFEDVAHYPVDTPVYFLSKNNGQWHAGTITSFFDGVYTVRWDDGSGFEYFDDKSVVDALVQNAEFAKDTKMHSIGTPVLDGSRPGKIVSYSDGMYVIRWKDGTTESMAPQSSLDAMVENAANTNAPTKGPTKAPTKSPTSSPVVAPTNPPFASAAPSAAPVASETKAPTQAPTVKSSEEATPDPTQDGTPYVPWDIGTDVYKFFAGDGWAWGNIVWYDDGVYKILWEDDSTETYDDVGGVDQMVRDAEKKHKNDTTEDDPWDVGTAVFKTFEGDGDYFGKIVFYADGEYTVRWSDGSVDFYTSDETDKMVEDAYENVQAAKAAKASKETNTTATTSASAKDDNKPSAGGKVVLSMIIIGAFLGAVCLIRRRSRGVEKMGSPKGKNLAPSSYKDEPAPDMAPEIPDVI